MKKFLLLLLLLLSRLVVTAQNNEAYYLEQEAIELIGQGNYIEAIGKYNRIIELFPDKGGLYYNRAWCYDMLNMYEEAIADLEKAVQYDEYLSDAHYLLAQLLYTKGDKKRAVYHVGKMEGGRDTPQNQLFLEALSLNMKQEYDEALVLFKQCTELNIQTGHSSYFIGEIYFKRYQYDQAIDYFRQALKLKSYKNGSDIYLMLGGSESKLKQYFNAFYTLNKYIDGGPPYAYAYYHRGISRLRIRDFTYELEPLDDFRKILALDPASAEGAHGIACFHIVARRYKEGKTMLDSLIQIYPYEPEFYIELGKAYAGLKNPDQAHKSFNKAKQLNPAMSDPYLEAGILYLDQHLPEQALQELETAMRLDTAHKLITVYYARAISLLGKANEAQQMLNALFLLPSEQCSLYYKRLAHYVLGMILMEQKKEKAAREHLEDAFFRIEEAGLYYGDWWLEQGDKVNAERIYSGSIMGSFFDNVELECRLGAVYLMKKKYWDARFTFNKAVEINPGLAEAHLGLGRAQFGLKYYAEAMDELTKAIELDENLSEAYYQRALLHLAQKNKDLAQNDLQIAADLGHEKAQKHLKKQE